VMTSSTVAQHSSPDSAQLIPTSPPTGTMSPSHVRQTILQGTSRGDSDFSSSLDDKKSMHRSLADQTGGALIPSCARNEATFFSRRMVQTDPAAATSVQNACSTLSGVSVIGLMQHNVEPTGAPSTAVAYGALLPARPSGAQCYAADSSGTSQPGKTSTAG
jgi:hypothetical protein